MAPGIGITRLTDLIATERLHLLALGWRFRLTGWPPAHRLAVWFHRMYATEAPLNRKTHAIAIAGYSALILIGCSQDAPNGARAPEMPRFADQHLAEGRSVWMGTCRNCHLMGVAGAPAVTNFAEWERRLPKGKEALYHSALNGIPGPDGQYRMPPRGGNDRLTDDQVRSAVDYKVAAVEALQKESKEGR